MPAESELATLAHQLEELNRIGAALSAERDTARLLDLILTKAREITDSDAGSLYVVEAAAADQSPRRLRFKIAQNESVALPSRSATTRLNGTGYPPKLAAPEIPVQTRMMTIADIFDALSAADRPYKKAVPIERALGILSEAVKDGELDADLFELFVGACLR